MQQVATAWVLQRSPVVLAILGTSKLRHAEDNFDAAWLRLTQDELALLDAAHAGGTT
jgi:pyridoxine 4-dehydrogenase